MRIINRTLQQVELHSEVDLPNTVFVDDVDPEAIDGRHQSLLDLGDAPPREVKSFLHAQIWFVIPDITFNPNILLQKQ